MVLCIGFVDEMVLVTPVFWLLWTVLTQHQGLHIFPAPLLSLTPSKWAGGKQEVGRGHSWESWSKLAKYIYAVPYNIMLSHKAGGRERKAGGCLPGWLWLGWALIRLWEGGLCVIFVVIFFSYWTVFIWTQEFSCFCSSLAEQEREMVGEWAAGWVLDCWLG